MDVDEYENKFFEIAKKRSYEIGRCKIGPFRGERLIDFGTTKLHAGHIRMLYQLAREKSPRVSCKDFETIVPGRPSAIRHFNEINGEIFE